LTANFASVNFANVTSNRASTRGRIFGRFRVDVGTCQNRRYLPSRVAPLARLDDIRQAVLRGLAILTDIRQAVLRGLARLANGEFGEFYTNLASLASFIQI
jgi:hypothetical protein